MGRKYAFVDEAGNVDFSGRRGSSRYFVLTSVALDDCAIGTALLDLRREVAWEGVELEGQIHATEETQRGRDRVFAVLANHDFRIDSTIIDKPKTPPHLREATTRFYKTAWYLHLQYVVPEVALAGDDLLVAGASVGTHREQSTLRAALADAVARAAPGAAWRTAFWSAASDPCLQVADYCCWAIQRKWERGDDRSYVLIRRKIYGEFDVMAGGPGVLGGPAVNGTDNE